jgi:hypothetical protein
MTRRAVEKAGLEIKESAKAMQISYLGPRERDVNGEKKQIPMMSVSLKSYRTGQVSLSEQVMFVSFKSYRTGQVSLSVQVMFVSF